MYEFHKAENFVISQKNSIYFINKPLHFLKHALTVDNDGGGGLCQSVAAGVGAQNSRAWFSVYCLSLVYGPALSFNYYTKLKSNGHLEGKHCHPQPPTPRTHILGLRQTHLTGHWCCCCGWRALLLPCLSLLLNAFLISGSFARSGTFRLDRVRLCLGFHHGGRKYTHRRN